ncbi:hypothetical protein Arub01_17340 [Actinomadura rubrobrunea]|uniref:Uncharacterized protein n=1 Tax=Actinomadura rubrobrunea TaxID=115335 RepID=A0A9W6PS47_9ACTN|nr:hypothetical protein [Actinomadura rubrobrunea]GLW63490.1 hypothetical protein Arub01_17340 [Actinomadura rubrobrunea]
MTVPGAADPRRTGIKNDERALDAADPAPDGDRSRAASTGEDGDN